MKKNLFPNYNEFINEAKTSFLSLDVDKTSYGTKSYTIEKYDVRDHLVMITLYAAKGSDMMDEDESLDLNPKMTYLTFNASVHGTYIFKIKDWMKIYDFLKEKLNEDSSDAKITVGKTSISIDCVAEGDDKKTSIEFTFVPEDEWDEDGKYGEYYVSLTIGNTDEIYFTKKQIAELLSFKFN